MYKIKISYMTGDSFGSEDTYRILELSWNNLDVAKANLMRIKEHYMCYMVDNDYGGKKGYYFKSLSQEDKLMYDTKNKRDWYHGVSDDYHYRLVLKTDTGADWSISPFWAGYFETLYSAEIINNDSNLKVEF